MLHPAKSSSRSLRQIRASTSLTSFRKCRLQEARKLVWLLSGADMCSRKESRLLNPKRVRGSGYAVRAQFQCVLHQEHQLVANSCITASLIAPPLCLRSSQAQVHNLELSRNISIASALELPQNGQRTRNEQREGAARGRYRSCGRAASPSRLMSTRKLAQQCMRRT